MRNSTRVVRRSSCVIAKLSNEKIEIPRAKASMDGCIYELNEEFARILYESFRSADIKGLRRVFVIPPTGDGIAVAINDRLSKSAFEK